MFNEMNNLTSKLEVTILPLYKTFSIVVKKVGLLEQYKYILQHIYLPIIA